MNACPNCGAVLESASYMHDASGNIWFDFICGGCGYHSEATISREDRAAIAELIEADKEYDAAKRQVNDETLTAEEHHSASWPRLYAAQDRRAAALARVGGGK